MHHPKLTTLGAALGAFLALCGTSAAQYDCMLGTFEVDTIACLNLTAWAEQPEYFGAYTDIRIPTMACAGCDGMLTNGVEISEESTNCYFPGCWVKAGYALDLAHPAGYYYVEEKPPGGQQRFTFLGPVQQPGALTHFMIVKDARTTPHSFLTFVYNDSLSILWASTSRTLTGIPMRADGIQLRAWLTGTDGISSAQARSFRNIWAVAPLGPEYVFWYRPQTTRGWEYRYGPFIGGWNIPPGLPPPAPEGGMFTMECCTP